MVTGLAVGVSPVCFCLFLKNLKKTLAKLTQV